MTQSSLTVQNYGLKHHSFLNWYAVLEKELLNLSETAPRLFLKPFPCPLPADFLFWYCSHSWTCMWCSEYSQASRDTFRDDGSYQAGVMAAFLVGSKTCVPRKKYKNGRLFPPNFLPWDFFTAFHCCL